MYTHEYDPLTHLFSHSRNEAAKVNSSENDESYDPQELEWEMAFLYITLVLLN